MEALFFAKTPAGFKISKIRQPRVTCYLDEFGRRTQLLRTTAVILQHVVDNLQNGMSNRNTGSLLASSGCQASETGTQKAIFCMAGRLSRQY